MFEESHSIPEEELNVNSGDIVLKTMDKNLVDSIKISLKKLTRKVLISGKIEIKLNTKMILTVTDSVNEVVVTGDTLISKAINQSASHDDVINQISKLGNTIYEFDNLEVDLEDDLFSGLNLSLVAQRYDKA